MREFASTAEPACECLRVLDRRDAPDSLKQMAVVEPLGPVERRNLRVIETAPCFDAELGSDRSGG